MVDYLVHTILHYYSIIDTHVHLQVFLGTNAPQIQPRDPEIKLPEMQHLENIMTGKE